LTNNQNISNNGLFLILDNLRSLLNVGAIFRTADAVGVKKIYLCGITAYPTNKLIKRIDNVDIDPIIGDKEGNAIIIYKPSKKCTTEFLHQEIAKTALSALDAVEWEYSTNTLEVISRLKKESVNIISLEQTDRSIDYCEANYSAPLAIVIGHERLGVSKNVLDLSDQIVEIPMMGVGKSLNVSTAAGIILYKAIEKSELNN